MQDSEQLFDAGQFVLREPGPGCVRVGVLAAIPDLLRTYTEVSPERVLAEFGIEPGLLDYPENHISFELGGRLLEYCANETGFPHFGLLLGQLVRSDTLGQFAELAIYAPDVDSAIRNMIMHISIHDRGGAPILNRDHAMARFGYAIYEPIRAGVMQINDLSMTMICHLMRTMCGSSWTPAEVHFSHARPRDIGPYESFFRARLVFDSDLDALFFPDSWLNKPLPNANPERYQCLLQRFKLLEADMEIMLEEKIRALVRPLVASRNCTHENVAALLALHPRTLNRRLQGRGTTLRRVIGEMRFEMAKQMLCYSEATVTEISALLGYSDSSVLTRSFQRWSGLSPSQWREQHR